jgi:glycosyltransferase involved in cell wall biosynthesis
MQGEMLARAYASADAFIFPSKTDTFGLVLIEAMACGTPIAAYPVMGPIDIVTPASGVLSDNLTDAVHAALKLDRNGVTGAARTYNWERATDQFLAALRPFEIKGLTQTALCVA